MKHLYEKKKEINHIMEISKEQYKDKKKKYCFLTVLGLAGMEVTFFIAAHTVLCFGFVATTVLITHQCFSFC